MTAKQSCGFREAGLIDAICRVMSMRRGLLVLLGAATLCIATADAMQPQGQATSTVAAGAGATRWQPWRATEIPLSAAQRELQADLIRHVEMTTAIRSWETFPLAGDLLGGRTCWAAVVASEIIVYERRAGGWREVTRHELDRRVPGLVAPVDIEPAHAWIVTSGERGVRLPVWEVLRFDGELVRQEIEAHWSDVMLVDVDLDGTVEILGEQIDHVNCDQCGLSTRWVDLYRWNGAEIAPVGFEMLPVGSAADPVVAANNRATELAGAERWAEALAVVDGARALVGESAVFRRNARLIDLNAAAPGRPRSGPDTLLHYVSAGLWTDAVDIFRHKPILPDFFATPPPYMNKYMMERSKFGTPPLLGAVYEATSSARRVPPALPEIEFLRAWSAYHLLDWSAYLERRDRSDPVPESKSWDLSWSGLIEPGESAVLESLERAATLAPNDPLFAEALRLVAARADMAHTDAMRRTFLLFDTGVDGCAEPGCMEPGQRAEVPGDIGATSWLAWQAPDGRPLADVPRGADLIRRLAAVYHEDGESIEEARAFPLSGTRFAGRAFWAVFDPSADTCRARRRGVAINYSSDCRVPVLAVYENGDGGWREVTQRRVGQNVVSVVAPTDVELSQAWIVTRGVNGWNVGANVLHWEVLRFDGEFLHVELVGNWQDAMIAVVDGDGEREILGSETFPLCFRCPVAQRVVRLYRWTGARMVAVPLDMLSSGAASDQAIAANNRAVELARARRWAEAAAVLDDVRTLVGESPVFRRNASLIDLNAAGSGGEHLSEDTLLHYVFAGQWAAAVDLFRDAPAGPDLFAAPPYRDASTQSRSGYGSPPFLRAIFDATAAARAVAPARPDIEFLHAWSAFHLDPDTTGAPSTSRRDAGYRIDVDESVVFEVLDRAVALAPNDPLYAETRRVVAERLSP